MRELTKLVTRIANACHANVTLRAVAQVAADALVDLFPGSVVVVFEREVRGATARAVAGANIPEAWRMRAVQVAEVPMLGEALARPEHVVRSKATQRDGESARGRRLALCGALPDDREPIYAILFLAPPGADDEAVETAVDTARQLLAAGARLWGSDAANSRTQAAIYHAKVEWESAVDAIPEIVGLLDRRGRVLRVSRGLERWRLGDVREAIKHDLHAVLHAGCKDDGCGLARALTDAQHQLNEAAQAAFALHDPYLGRDIEVELKRVAGDQEATAFHTRLVAFVITDVTALRDSERALTALNQDLESRVADRTGEYKRAVGALQQEVVRREEIELTLRASQRELETLSERLMTAQEAERQRICQDLHDSVGQSLSAIKYSLERAQVLGRRQQLREAVEVVETTVERVQRVIEEVRSISMNLRPSMLDDLGAASAVKCLCREWHDVYSEIALDTDIRVDDADIPPMLGTNVFRAVQESLNNVARHAHARRVGVSMRVSGGTLEVVVSDDGAGFALNGDVRRLVERPEVGGLRSLRERAERSGGRCHVATAPGRGTTVRLEWPVAPGQAARNANASLN